MRLFGNTRRELTYAIVSICLQFSLETIFFLLSSTHPTRDKKVFFNQNGGDFAVNCLCKTKSFLNQFPIALVFQIQISTNLSPLKCSEEGKTGKNDKNIGGLSGVARCIHLFKRTQESEKNETFPFHKSFEKNFFYSHFEFHFTISRSIVDTQLKCLSFSLSLSLQVFSPFGNRLCVTSIANCMSFFHLTVFYRTTKRFNIETIEIEIKNRHFSSLRSILYGMHTHNASRRRTNDCLPILLTQMKIGRW